MSGGRKTALMAAALWALNAAANAPFFLPGEPRYKDSIEAGYASMAKFVSEHPDPFGWNPLQYKGLPTHDWYLPVIPYAGATAIRLLPFAEPSHAYRILVVTLASFGPVTLFLFLHGFTRVRRWAFGTAIAYSVLSATYLFFPVISADRGISYLPWRIQVLVKYGEGPHNAGLMLMPLALLACWRAATQRSFRSLAAAAALLATVTLTNWVAAFATAWCCLMMLLVGRLSRNETGFLVRRLLAAAGLAYLLACFWLTPRLIANTFFNWPTDAIGFGQDSLRRWLAGGLVVLPLAIIWLFRRWRAHYLLSYLLCCLAGFAWIVTLHYRLGIDVIPESRRYAIELELFLFAAAGEAVRHMLAAGSPRWLRDGVLVTAGFLAAFVWYQPGVYLLRTWPRLQPTPREASAEFRAARRVAELAPTGRVFAPGGTRFRLNSWFGIQQLGGTFESGLRNRNALHFAYHIQRGQGRPPEKRAADAVKLLRASGVEYLIVHGPGSNEHWRDVANPELIGAQLELVWREGDDSLYRVPFRGLANLVEPGELPPGLPVGDWVDYLKPYLAAMDNPARPALETRWEGASAVVIRAPAIPAGMLVTLRVSFDPRWRAWQDEREIPATSDQMGNLLLSPRPAPDRPTEIQLRYAPPRQQIAGTAVSLLTAAGCLAALWRERRRRRLPEA